MESNTKPSDFSYGGTDFIVENNPLQAINVCLQASSNCGSKYKAWDWAERALEIMKYYFPKHFSWFQAELGNGSYPNTNIDFKPSTEVVEKVFRSLENDLELNTLNNTLLKLNKGTIVELVEVEIDNTFATGVKVLVKIGDDLAEICPSLLVN